MLKSKKRSNKKRGGFVLANGMVALGLIVIALVWLGLCQHQLKFQREKMRTSLRVVRLAKESTDQLITTGHQAVLADGRWVATARPGSVCVRDHSQVVYEVRL